MVRLAVDGTKVEMYKDVYHLQIESAVSRWSACACRPAPGCFARGRVIDARCGPMREGMSAESVAVVE